MADCLPDGQVFL